MKIKRKDLHKLCDAIIESEMSLMDHSGLKVRCRTTTLSEVERAALALLTLRQQASVTPDDEVQLAGFGGLNSSSAP